MGHSLIGARRSLFVKERVGLWIFLVSVRTSRKSSLKKIFEVHFPRNNASVSRQCMDPLPFFTHSHYSPCNIWVTALGEISAFSIREWGRGAYFIARLSVAGGGGGGGGKEEDSPPYMEGEKRNMHHISGFRGDICQIRNTNSAARIFHFFPIFLFLFLKKFPHECF